MNCAAWGHEKCRGVRLNACNVSDAKIPMCVAAPMAQCSAGHSQSRSLLAPVATQQTIDASIGDFAIAGAVLAQMAFFNAAQAL